MNGNEQWETPPMAQEVRIHDASTPPGGVGDDYLKDLWIDGVRNPYKLRLLILLAWTSSLLLYGVAAFVIVLIGSSQSTTDTPPLTLAGASAALVCLCLAPLHFIGSSRMGFVSPGHLLCLAFRGPIKYGVAALATVLAVLAVGAFMEAYKWLAAVPILTLLASLKFFPIWYDRYMFPRFARARPRPAPPSPLRPDFERLRQPPT
jgi:hypothetical protein